MISDNEESMEDEKIPQNIKHSGQKKMLTMEDIYGDEDGGDDYGSESEEPVVQEDHRVLLTKK